MSDQNKTVLLESKVRRLKEMLLQQITFGKRMTDIVAKMDQLLTRKSIENENLKKQLQGVSSGNQSDVQPPNSPTTKDVGDFSIVLEPPTLELIENDVSEATVEVFEMKTEAFEITEANEIKSELFSKKTEIFDGHTFEKTESGELICPYKENCTYVSKHRNRMRKHIRTHTGEKPYVCNKCERTFGHLDSVKKHVLVCTGPTDTIDLSELFTKTSEIFDNLVFEKTGNGELKCPYKENCNFASNHRNTMRSHFRTHTKEKPYICNLCEGTFANITSVKRHLLTHSGMKGVNCKFCYHRWPASKIENHQTKCPERKRVSRKRARSNSDSDD